MTKQCKHEWFFPDFDNSAYAHCVKCPDVLEPKEIAILLNEHAALKRIYRRIQAADHPGLELPAEMTAAMAEMTALLTAEEQE